MKIRAIAISGEIASGKSAIAEKLAGTLNGWKLHTAGQIYRDYCKTHHIQFAEAHDRVPDEVNRMIDAQQGEIIQTHSNIIADGRLSGWLGRDLADVLRVFCYAEPEIRAQRLSKRDGIPVEKARAEISLREAHDIATFQHIYGIQDYRAPALYHLRLDTSFATIEEMARHLKEVVEAG
jgi:cytidylate kinase